MQIRIATAKDEHSLVGMVVDFRNHLERQTPTDSQFQESIRLLLASEDAEFIIASIEHRAVGYVLQRYRHSMWAAGQEMTIEDLFVDPAGRKQGTGKALIQFALARAREVGCSFACLDTNEFNIASTKIYTELGFESLSKRWNGRQIFYRKSIARLPEEA
ncbi:N/A [soil metagenome]